jgi:hypothetical protein
VATNINVAVSIDLMTILPSIDAGAIKHICLVGNTGRGCGRDDEKHKDIFAKC